MARTVYGNVLARTVLATSDSLVGAARDRIEAIENRLAQASLPYCEDQRRKRIGIREVRAALSKDAATARQSRAAVV